MTYLEPIKPQPTDLSIVRVLAKLKSGATPGQIAQCCAECRAALKSILTQPDLMKLLESSRRVR